ncbi:DNA cytosine methyltransferase [Ligilactobacillus ruminis]|uniref:DNA cytosine methyltransferase n=1 Tax=Ligilactobacillus ruminis TaxID=1623 RepID=UPI002657B24D|nr:DNA (cytosine-5-)-methyltransferase [Ligilactobacillus ruminis]WKB70199.1 DNA (cytosine-5-)-methyltransferase [Ligilactobacillus ruminis]
MRNSESKTLKFADLFSGIGGFRLGLERNGMECVFSADIDTHACEMYKENYGDDSFHDITAMTDEEISNIPDFDILTGGFPCQSFSISGRKKGFMDETRGTLFFEILRFLSIKRPRAFILENVKNLVHHDGGRTFTVMVDSLNRLGYTINHKVLNSKDFGVPQNRERIVIVGSNEGKFFDFNKLEMNPVHSMLEFLDNEGDFEYLDPSEYTLLPPDKVKRQSSDLIFVGYRNKKIRVKGVRPNTEYLSRVHKMPNRIYSAQGVNPTISSQESSGRYFILLPNGKVRKLTINECYRFMGFPDDFKKVGQLSKLYNRIGNSVCVPMIESVGKVVKDMLFNEVDESDPTVFLEKIYKLAGSQKGNDAYNGLTEENRNFVDTIVSKEKMLKGLYTVLITSLTYKCLYPEQDVRLHQASLKGGYSGRSFDTKYVTPFLKKNRFSGAMKESGWLTRSLEQPEPFDMNFPGKISNKNAKFAFLSILNNIEMEYEKPENYLLAIFAKSIERKAKEEVVLIRPVQKESSLKIDDIMHLLKLHFGYKNYTETQRGNSILPVIAFYSIYESLIKEMARYKGKKLTPRKSHYSSDKNSGETGDIVIRDKNNNIYEVVEIKSDKLVDVLMVNDAYNKFKSLGSVQRYYILSTVTPDEKVARELSKRCDEIFRESGTQIICNGLMKTLNYYLRLLDSTDEFINNYIKNVESDPELNAEHKISWNIVYNEYMKKYRDKHNITKPGN